MCTEDTAGQKILDNNPKYSEKAQRNISPFVPFILSLLKINFQNSQIPFPGLPKVPLSTN